MAKKHSDEESTALLDEDLRASKHEMEAASSCNMYTLNTSLRMTLEARTDDDCSISPLEKSSTKSRSSSDTLERLLFTAKKDVNIVFVGKSGAGKSVLKNNILEIEQDLQIGAGHITDDYSIEKVEKHGVTITITDTVGLEGGKEQCKRSLEKMSRHVNEHGTVDLLVYCLPVGPSSKFNDQLVIMESLHEAFGEDIWKNCIVVFTFSNLILDRIRKKKGVSSEATALYEDHIKDYASKFEDQLTQLKVRNIQVKTVFDLPLEKPQPADLTTIMAIPAGDDPQDQVLPGIQFTEALDITNQTGKTKIRTWSGVLFFVMLHKFNDELKKTLLQYRYGLSKVEIGAIVGSIVGTIGFIPGMAIGAAVGAGAGALIETLEEIKIKKRLP